MARPTLDEALRAAVRGGLERLDAQLLLADLLGRDRAWLIAHGDECLEGARLAAWNERVRRRATGEPLAYVLGRQQFFGLELQVDRRVLVPRADTETLVRWAVEILTARDRTAAPAAVVDLGTGSGAIALAIRHAHPGARVTAIDASEDALQVARANAERLELAIELRHGDWWGACDPASRYDLAVANPPYVAADDPHLAALHDEPIGALVSGADGLDAIRAIVAGAPAHIRPGAWLLFEHGHEQAAAAAAVLAQSGFADIETRRDLAGRPRCTGGTIPVK